MITQEQLENGMGRGIYHVTAKEMQLAKEYEDQEHTDTVEAYARRARIVQELHDLRERLNSAADRMFAATGKGRNILHADDDINLTAMLDEEINCIAALSDNGVGAENIRMNICQEIILEMIEEEIEKLNKNEKRAYQKILRRVEKTAPQAVLTYKLIVSSRNNIKMLRAWVRFALSILNLCDSESARKKYNADFGAIERAVLGKFR